MKNKLLLTSIALTIFLSSCKKDSNDVIGGGDISNLVVPASFNWQTARDVNFSVAIHDNRFQNALHIVEVFQGDPTKGGTILAKGAASLTTAFNFKAELPAGVNEVYLTKTAPDGSKNTQKAMVESTEVSLSLGIESITQAVSVTKTSIRLPALRANVVVENSPGCAIAQGETEITTSPNSQIDLNGETYVITGNNVNVNFRNLNRGNVRICGTGVTINGLKVISNVNIIVTEKADVTFNNFNWEGAGTFKNFGIARLGNVKTTGSFYNSGKLTVGEFLVEGGTASNISEIIVNGNTKIIGTFNNTGTLTTNELTMEGAAKAALGGTVTVKGNFNATGTIVNTGNFTISGVYNSNGTPDFTNSGTLNLANNITIAGKFTNSGTIISARGDINFNNNPTFVNSGIFTARLSKMNVSGSLTNAGNMVVQNMTINSGTLTNTCFLNVLVEFDNNANIINHSYIQVDERSNLKGTFNLHNAAMFRTKTLIALDGTVTGHGSTSLFKVDVSSTNNVNDNGNQKFKDALQYCDPSRTIKASQFTGGAIQGCDVYIAINNCNPVGNGIVPGPVLVDTDKDGVIDTEDDYPNDKTKAFNNYSVNYEKGGSTVAFEDSWPMKGDYDLNDVVIGYKYLVVTSASNQVVHIKADYALLATGGEYQSGAGIQFNLPAKSAANFKTTTGVKLEAGQDSVVVILFTSSRNEQVTWNTIPGQAISPVKNYDVSFDVVDGPQFAAFGIGTYNPFIWNVNRGNETHMIGKTPTKFANADAFGTNDDNSKAGKTYSTKTNLPWAISVPIRPFEYPSEKIAITDTYLRFADWASSGGANSKDWYFNTASGFRNTANIYKAN
jgi:LruC domain-containing protein